MPYHHLLTKKLPPLSYKKNFINHQSQTAIFSKIHTPDTNKIHKNKLNTKEFNLIKAMWRYLNEYGKGEIDNTYSSIELLRLYPGISIANIQMYKIDPHLAFHSSTRFFNENLSQKHAFSAFKALLNFNNKQLDLAKVFCEESIKLKRDFAFPYLILGNIALAQQQFQEATAQYDKALALQPALTHALIGKGHAQKELGNLEEAVAHFQTALKLNPIEKITTEIEKLLAGLNEPNSSDVKKPLFYLR